MESRVAKNLMKLDIGGGAAAAEVCLKDLDEYYLPDSVLVEILIRLPLKSIFKFKTVSKHWLSLISDPFFTRCYVTRFNSVGSKLWALIGDHLLIYDGVNREIGTRLSLLCIPPKLGCGLIATVASHNGWLFCDVGSLCWKGIDVCCICNPLTKQYFLLPERDTFFCGAGIIFSQDHDAEEGYYSYKVVRILPYMPERINSLTLEIFSSETGQWNDIDLSYPCHSLHLERGNGLAYNGALHWVSSPNKKIIAYDPFKNNNHLRLIDLPRELMVPCERGSILNVSSGHLCYLSFNWDDMYLTLWVLVDYRKGEWCLKHKTKFSGMICDDVCDIEEIPTPKAVHPFDFNTVYLIFSSTFISYNFQTRKFGPVLHSDLVTWFHSFTFSPWPALIRQPSWYNN